jgi:hypothetical protein
MSGVPWNPVAGWDVPADYWADDAPEDDGDDFDNEDWLDMECGLDDDGQCSQAGTEHCDFECPWRDSDQFAGSEAWNRSHGDKK